MLNLWTPSNSSRFYFNVADPSDDTVLVVAMIGRSVASWWEDRDLPESHRPFVTNRTAWSSPSSSRPSVLDSLFGECEDCGKMIEGAGEGLCWDCDPEREVAR